MDNQSMRVELIVESPQNHGYFFYETQLPTTKALMEDARQRVRWGVYPNMMQELSVVACPWVPELTNVRLDAPKLEELNYLAWRLRNLPEHEQTVYRALFQKLYGEAERIEPVSVEDLINMTYGLDQVAVAADIWNDEDLGNFVIENELHPDVAAIPDESLYLLDAARIGALQREQGSGVLLNGYYIETAGYELPHVYVSVDRPKDEPEDRMVFRLQVSEAPVNSWNETLSTAEWIELPMRREEADNIAAQHNEAYIEDCALYAVESVIPQITMDTVEDLDSFDALSTLAAKYRLMCEEDRIKFKAVLTATPPKDISDALDLAENLNAYEFVRSAPHEGVFFKDYLAHYLDIRLDRRWLDTFPDGSEGFDLLRALGATITDYGIVSAPGRSLYEIVPMDAEQTEDYADMDMDNGEQTMGGM